MALGDTALPFVLSTVRMASPFFWKLAHRAHFYSTIGYVKVLSPQVKVNATWTTRLHVQCSQDCRVYRLVLHVVNGCVEHVIGAIADSGLATIFILYFNCFHTGWKAPESESIYPVNFDGLALSLDAFSI